MSLVVLQRKSRRYQAPISGQGTKGFALNGTLRNIGSVGPTNLAKSVTRTPFRGSEPMGHGGCCGTYNRTISNSGSCCVNDSNIVKVSTKNTQAMLEGKNIMGCCSQYPKWIVKTPPHPAGQGEYIRNVHFSAAQCICDLSNGLPYGPEGNKCVSGTPGSNFIGTRRLTNQCTQIAKGDCRGLDYDIYIQSLFMKKNCLPSSGTNLPLPKWQNNTSCHSIRKY